MPNETIYRVWKTQQQTGCPAEMPVKDFEGDLSELCLKYTRGPGHDDLQPFSNGGFSTSYSVESQSGDGWEVCDDPRPRI